jgi:hypothetical protein
MNKRKANPYALPKPITRAEAVRQLRLGKTLDNMGGGEWEIGGIRVHKLAVRSIWATYEKTGQLRPLNKHADQWLLDPDPVLSKPKQVAEAIRTNDIPTALRLLREMEDG